MTTISKFMSPDSTETLILRAWEGKSGFRVLASVKQVGTKIKAITGCRESFKTEAEAKDAFKKLSDEAVKRGWTTKNVTKRNAFSMLPEPSKDKAPAAVVAKAKKAPKAAKVAA